MIFPDELKEALSALNHDIRWRIVELIQEEETLAYTELLEKLNIQKGSLSHHLNRLMEAGILDNYAKEEFGGPYNSYYKLSRFGKDFVVGLLSSVEMTIPIEAPKRRIAPEIQPFETRRIEKRVEYAALPEIASEFEFVNTPAHELINMETKINTRERYSSILQLLKEKIEIKSRQGRE